MVARVDRAIKTGENFETEGLSIAEIDAAVFNTSQLCINSVKYMFSESAWEKLIAMISMKKTNYLWCCSYCSLGIDVADEFVNCQRCLMRFHSSCTEKRRTKDWVCKFCKTSTTLETKMETPSAKLQTSLELEEVQKDLQRILLEGKEQAHGDVRVC